MKTCRTIFFIFLAIALLLPFGANAQWEQTNGPFSSSYFRTVWADNNMFLGVPVTGSMFISTDDCFTWERVDIVLNHLDEIRVFTYFDNKYWAFSAYARVFTSTDGKNWVEMITPWQSFNEAGVQKAFIWGNQLLLFNYRYILEYNVDSSHFQKLKDFRDISNSYIIGSWYTGGKFFVQTDKLWISPDALTWTDYSEGIGGQELTGIVQIPGTTKILAITKYGELFYRNTGDIAWQSGATVFNGKILRSITVGQKDTAVHIYINTESNGIWKSSDNGGSWVQIQIYPGSGNKCRLTGLVQENMNYYLIATGTSRSLQFKSVDGGLTWTESSQGFYGTPRAICGLDGKDSIILTQVNGRLFRTNTKGENWELVPFFEDYAQYLSLSIDEFLSIKEGPEEKEVIYAATHGRGIVKSYDKGLNWQAYNSNYGDPQTYVNCIVQKKRPDGSQVLLVGTVELGIMRSVDDGISWSVLQNQLWYENIEDLAVSSGDAIYALADYKAVYRSKDEGMNWTLANNGLEGKTIVDLYHYDYENQSYIFASTDDGVFRSANEGENWEMVLPDSINQNSNLWQNLLNSSFSHYGDTLYAIRFSDVYWSHNGGSSWSLLNMGLPEHRQLSACSVVGDYLYLSLRFNGIWKYKIGSKTNAVPLSPNYTNGDCLHAKTLAGGSTLLQFNLESASPVRLNVFDLQGRLLSTLADTNLGAGSYSYAWSGEVGKMYICTLETAFCRQSRKVFGAKD